MAPNKRGSLSDEGNDERDLQLPLCKRKAALPDTRYLSSLDSTNHMALILEPVIRKVLQEMMPPMLEQVMPRMLEQVIPPILQRYLPSPWGQISPAAGRGRSLQLCLMKGLPATIFTQISITAEDSSPLQVAVCDATIQNIKVTNSLKVQLCVLKGDFESEDWTAEEFNSNIESPREGKGPLLKGDTVITMENGVGFFKNVEFTDNSCWTRSGKFRLGIKVLSSNSSPAADIKEARSERIRVKDKRGVANEKPDRPSLDDKVSCLRKIAKNGPIRKQLSSNGIKTVKDLLRLLTTDQASLKQKTGHIPGKSWEKIIEHAKSCAIDNDERYIYQYFAGTAEQPIAASLVLNCIYEPVAISFDGQNFCSLESLSSEGKTCACEWQRWVETAKRQAYKNLKDLKPFGASSAGQSLENFDFPVSHQQGQGVGQAQMVQASASTASYIGEGAQSVNEQVGCSSQHQVGWEEFVDDSGWSNISMNAIQVDPYPNYSDPVYPSYYVGGDYGATSSNDSFPIFDVHYSSKGGCNTVWAKIRTAVIRNVLKWAILYAAKRKPKLLVPYQ
ncbi:calmodulin-binding protein 60 G isoform X3 [Arachis ipaensis]|uniref:calmodulin-binding protein 60 G isoform X3 n=2 Tax=Arachis ipaensis TaxID=130454 RepID=UPI000A2B052D|nr:calmodulin-binding protein 60 G isoform X3 [Arachis ipaensis]XP_025662405.1 calmodulin-binding protein 60 G isoform X2 [Arachis hypogaea]